MGVCVDLGSGLANKEKSMHAWREKSKAISTYMSYKISHQILCKSIDISKGPQSGEISTKASDH